MNPAREFEETNEAQRWGAPIFIGSSHWVRASTYLTQPFSVTAEFFSGPGDRYQHLYLDFPSRILAAWVRKPEHIRRFIADCIPIHPRPTFEELTIDSISLNKRTGNFNATVTIDRLAYLLLEEHGGEDAPQIKIRKNEDAFSRPLR